MAWATGTHNPSRAPVPGASGRISVACSHGSGTSTSDSAAAMSTALATSADAADLGAREPEVPRPVCRAASSRTVPAAPKPDSRVFEPAKAH